MAVHDGHDGRVYGRRVLEGHARVARRHPEDLLRGPGPDRVGRHDGVAQGRLVLPAQGLEEEQGLAVDGGVLTRAEDPAHDLRQLHLEYFFSMPAILARRPSCRPPSNLVEKKTLRISARVSSPWVLPPRHRTLQS